MITAKKLIAFEGLHRCGKTTQLRPLEEGLRAAGFAAYASRRLNDPFAKEERERLRAEYGVFYNEQIAASMARVYREEYDKNCIAARILRGEVPLQDRQKFSVMAKGLVEHMPLERLLELMAEVPAPGFVIYIRIPPEESVRRSTLTGEKEQYKLDIGYVSRLFEAYEMLAGRFNFEAFDGMLAIEELRTQILGRVIAYLGRQEHAGNG